MVDVNKAYYILGTALFVFVGIMLLVILWSRLFD